MTYLELVNGVLTRMREDTVTTLAGESDPVVLIVADLVNDAKRTVEDSHTWNSLRYEWDFTTVPGQALYGLTDAGQYANIEYIFGSDGSELRQERLVDIKRKKSKGVSGNGTLYYAPNGKDANRDLQIELFPVPVAAVDFTVGGFKRQGDLTADDQNMLVPNKPVLYYALALAARERGEVGGQSSAELFQMANQFLSDAIAYDASNTELDNIWMTV
jgi:hypothetical protein